MKLLGIGLGRSGTSSLAFFGVSDSAPLMKKGEISQPRAQLDAQDAGRL